jgi:hypothetical protein
MSRSAEIKTTKFSALSMSNFSTACGMHLGADFDAATTPYQDSSQPCFSASLAYLPLMHAEPISRLFFAYFCVN